MLEVGTSLTDAVQALEAQTANPSLRSVLQNLGKDMEEGQSFSMAVTTGDASGPPMALESTCVHRRCAGSARWITPAAT